MDRRIAIIQQLSMEAASEFLEMSSCITGAHGVLAKQLNNAERALELFAGH
ncbi:hypothetical protein [Nitrincola sp. MINF-07-Sa-05]|uniref:hypothetical protein n=1 Tax=Nitrincola salilacus TaxID=3400273 RepID=UPI003917CE9B